LSSWFNYNFKIDSKMVDDIIEITTTSIKKELPINKIYEYEEDTELLITNSKSKEEEKKKVKEIQ
jgi:hypothetical protein